MRDAAMQPARSVYVVLPADVDDPDLTSGGNVYDQRIRTGLAEMGWQVVVLMAPGRWPLPDAAARAALNAQLTAVPDGAAVLFDGLIACGVPDVVAPHSTRLAVTVLVHLPLAEERGRPADVSARLNAAEGATLTAATEIAAASDWAARRLVELHGLSRDRIRVVCPGTDPAPPAAGTDGRSRLLCVGSVTPTKGQDVLVEALAGVADRPWTCDFVGPLRRAPEHVAALRGRIGELGLTGRVRLRGPYDSERLAAEYHMADLVISPSRVETFGMAVAEALARGVPVVSSAVGGLPDTVAGATAAAGSGPRGILVPPDDVGALAAALELWLDDARLRDRLRESAASHRGGFESWAVITAQLSDVLDRALRAGAPVEGGSA